MACAGLLYVILSALFRAFGAKKVMRFFPPIVTGPIIICIGITLANSAINNCAANWWIAILAVLVVVVCNIWGKGMVKIIPILLGVVISYVAAAIFGQLDPVKVQALRDAAWIGLPFQWGDTTFSLFGGADGSLLVSSIFIMMPIALATMVEHIGDMCAISSTVEQNFIAEPGLHRSLLGDGLATTLAALFGAPANTTYGENTGVLALTRVYDPRVVRIAACLAVLISFSPKFAALVSCMPTATIGGVSLILYGMISAVGVRNVVENQVDFTKSRNVIIAALIMSLALGINFSSAGAIAFTVFGGHRGHPAQRHPPRQRLRIRHQRPGRQVRQLQGVTHPTLPPARRRQALAGLFPCQTTVDRNPLRWYHEGDTGGDHQWSR